MPIDYRRYPPNWRTEIRPRILARAGQVRDPATGRITQHARCEFAGCGAVNYQPHPVTRKKVVLTVMHLDRDPENWNVTDDRLKLGCQRCHLNYDRPDNNRRKKYGKGIETQPRLFQNQ